MTGRRLGYLAALAGCFVFYVFYEQWLGWLLFVCLLGLPWLSLLLSLPAIVQFRARVAGPDRVELGQEAALSLLGGSQFPIPPFRGRLSARELLTGRTVSRCSGLTADTTHCGGIRVRPERVRVMDYLGLFSFPALSREEKLLLVMPRPLAMTSVPELDSLLARAWRPKPGGGFAENHELRPYRPGDSLNQLHWKLTAKTGAPIIREPMEPVEERAVVSVDISGTPEETDRKFGRLLWLGGFLLETGAAFEIHALTGAGLRVLPVSGPAELDRALDTLLAGPAAREGSVLDGGIRAAWHCHIGGEPDEQ